MVKDNGFILKADSGATMSGIFVAPGEVKIDVEETDRGRRILARGSNNFFVVMTVQNGIVADFEISGSGLDAQVRVGKRMILFRDDKIILKK